MRCTTFLLFFSFQPVAAAQDANATGPAAAETASQAATPPASDASAAGVTPPQATHPSPACSVTTLCLGRADLALLLSARAMASEGLYALAIKRYETLLTAHPSSPLLALATKELALARTAPMTTGPVPLPQGMGPAQPRSGTFTGILLGGGLAAATTASLWALTGDVEEPAVISSVLLGAAGAWAANRQLKSTPQTLGVMDTALLGAVWAPIITGMNLGANEVDLGDAMGITLAGSSIAGSAAGYLLGHTMNLHAGAATLAWSGAVLGGVEMGLIQVSLFPNGDNEKVFLALCSLGSLGGLLGGAYWAKDRRFSSGRGRIMTVSAYGAAGLTAATLSMIGADDSERVMTAAIAASFPLGAWVAYLFTEEVEKDEPRAEQSTDKSLAWALDQTATY